jgi:hypothetical protein
MPQTHPGRQSVLKTFQSRGASGKLRVLSMLFVLKSTLLCFTIVDLRAFPRFFPLFPDFPAFSSRKSKLQFS